MGNYYLAKPIDVWRKIIDLGVSANDALDDRLPGAGYLVGRNVAGTVWRADLSHPLDNYRAILRLECDAPAAYSSLSLPIARHQTVETGNGRRAR